MKKILLYIGKNIRKFLSLFYPLVRPFLSLQLFLYASVGAINIVLDWMLYFFTYNFLIQKQNLVLPFYTLSPHIAALAITFPITVINGFWLQKYVTFTSSTLKTYTQMFRYVLVVFLNLAINIIGLKLLVDGLHIYPTPSKMLITVITILVSYLFQKKFTFKS